MGFGDEILNAAEQHFAGKLNADEMHAIPVPEWGGTDAEPLVLYFKPSTLKEQDELYKYIQTGSLESLAELLIVRARDIDGNKLFKRAHKFTLMNKVDPAVLSRISIELAEAEGADLDSLSKK